MSNKMKLTIESLAPAGDGIAYVEDTLCFVPQTVPGDEIEAKVSRSEKFYRGRLIQVISPSQHRAEPPCGIYDKCGGCNLLHVTYEAQLKYKSKNLSRLLDAPSPLIITPSVPPLAYRKTARLHYHPGNHPGKKSHLGFLQPRSHRVLDIRQCPALIPAINNVIEPLKTTVLSHLKSKTEVTISMGREKPVVYLETDELPEPEFYAACRRSTFCAGIVVNVDGVVSVAAGSDSSYEMGFDDIELEMPAGSFGQANHGINLEMVRTVTEWIGESWTDTIALELFAGAGNFTVALAARCQRLITAEIDANACKKAEKNVKLRDITNVQVCRGSAEDIYDQYASKADVIFMDPPRAGDKPLIKRLATSEHRAIIYISCNPNQLKHDLQLLVAEGPYAVAHMQIFDMFAQTTHSEVAVMLTRRESS